MKDITLEILHDEIQRAHTTIGEVKQELKSDMGEIKSDLKQGLADISSHISGKYHALCEEIHEVDNRSHQNENRVIALEVKVENKNTKKKLIWGGICTITVALILIAIKLVFGMSV